jgi:6-phosphogluconolactonase
MVSARLCASALLAIALLGCTRAPARFVYVANFGSDDISAYRLDPATGALSVVRGSPFPAGRAPRAVTVTPSRRFAYVVNHGSHDVSAYRIDAKSGALTPVPGSPFPAAVAPRDVVVASSGRFLYVVCAGQAQLSAPSPGSIAAYSIHPDTGILNPLVGSPVPAVGVLNAAAVTPSGNFLFVSSGSAIAAYAVDRATGALTPAPGSPFPTGTLELVFDPPRSPLTGEPIGPPPSARFPYVANALAVAPSGQFVYAAVSAMILSPPGALSVSSLGVSQPLAPPRASGPRLVSAVSAFWIDPDSGALTPVAGSPWPSGTNAHGVTTADRFVYVANFTSHDISGYGVATVSGELSPLPGSPFPIGQASSVVVADPSGLLYFTYGGLASSDAGFVAAYTIDAGTGALTPVRGGSFAAGSKPAALAITPR